MLFSRHSVISLAGSRPRLTREERGIGDAFFDGETDGIECAFVDDVDDEINAADGVGLEDDDTVDEVVECLSTNSPRGVMRIPVEKVLSGG